MKRVNGIGGIFFKARDPGAMRDWYQRHLGLVTNDYGSLFEFRQAGSGEPAYLQWSPFKDDSDYFSPSDKPYMINYRVADLVALKKVLEEEGVEIVDDIEEYEYGKFLHVLDPEGNKIELWEPVDSRFTSEYQGQTTRDD